MRRQIKEDDDDDIVSVKIIKCLVIVFLSL